MWIVGVVMMVTMHISAMQLSELKLLSQSVPFPREDLPLGCSCGPLLDRYKAELESVREELKKRAIEMGVVRAELSLLQGEHQETVEELVETCTQLQDLIQDKTTLQAEVWSMGVVSGCGQWGLLVCVCGGGGDVDF